MISRIYFLTQNLIMWNDGPIIYLFKTISFGLTLTIFLGSINKGENTETLVCNEGSNWQDNGIKCINVAIRFLQHYLKALRRNSFVEDYCNEFQIVTKCLIQLQLSCPNGLQIIPERLMTIIHQFQCACNISEEYITSSYDCQNDMVCFESQIQSILGERCDGLYRFNLQQNVIGKCILKEEHIRCREALVSSACGHHMGNFIFNLSLEVMNKPDKCLIKKSSTYDGFYYDENCDVDFLREMENCEMDFLKRNLLKFSPDNDLIADANEKAIKRACRNFVQYEQCIDPIRDSCANGVQIVYGYDFVLRLYVLKMKFICHIESIAYMQQIKCLNKVLKDESLTKCSYIFENLQPILKSLSAFEFYCEPNSNSTLTIKNHLKELDVCYGNVFTHSCDVNTSTVMTGLLRHAFMDPFYLRYTYEPDCLLLDKSSRMKKGANSNAEFIEDPSTWALELDSFSKCSILCDNIILIIILQYYSMNLKDL